MVVDGETGEYLSAKVSLTSVTNDKDTIFTYVTSDEDGMASKQMTSVPANVHISSPGYQEYKGRIEGFDSDTFYIDLQPLPRNTKIILENLFFDFDKATIKMAESEEALSELYNMLINSPNMRIEISGHTDSKGSDAYNERLSNDRAKAVYDEMVIKSFRV